MHANEIQHVNNGHYQILHDVQKPTSDASMNRNEPPKPGASFAFKPRNNIASREKPDFSNHQANENETGDKALTDIGTMVNERAAPAAKPGDSKPQRPTSGDYDVDDILSAMRGLGSVKASARAGFDPSATTHPTFGHPTKMVSSRKQKADVFIHQRTRPEHHLGRGAPGGNRGTKMSGPLAPTYRDRKPPPLPVFNSNMQPKAKSTFSDGIFYTDPTKADADLKALLEGGIDGDEEEPDLPAETAGSKSTQDEATPVDEKSDDQSDEHNTDSPSLASAKTKKLPSKIGKDGIVTGLKVRLLPHQVEGVSWMHGRELGPVTKGKVPKGGLLADDMGLGKTLQSVSLILTNRKPEKDGPGWKKQYEAVEKTTLVVAPLALIRQWEHEIHDKVEESQGLKILVHHGPQRTKDFKEMAKYDVVVTTFQILVSEHGSSSDAVDGVKTGCFGLNWWRVILDEAHTIKNRNAKATKACYALRSEFRWCLSGTPMQNNLDELQSLVRFLRIAPYDDLKQWKEHIDKPMKNGKGHVAIRRLHALLQCFMKRRTKAILKEKGALNPGGEPSAEGEASSTGFRHTQRNVVTVSAKLAPAERQFYDRLEARADQRMEDMMRDKLSYANAFTLLLRLRQACNHPKLVEGKLEKDKDALSTDSSPKASQDTDVDSLADMFSGVGIVAKNCSVCGRDLTTEDTALGHENCAECHEDMEYFQAHQEPVLTSKRKTQRRRRRVKKPKSRANSARGSKTTETKVQEEAKPKARRPRNRNAIIDSDDEDEDEGSWLVPEEERGTTHLGKAGGEEDENAEGGGDWVGSEDSAISESDQDQSNLNSFVVDDEVAKKEKGYKSVDQADDDDDDSLASVADLTKAMASQTLEDNASKKVNKAASAPEASASDSEETEYTTEDESEEEIESASYTQVLASAKIRELCRLLRAEASEHKFIVFSQFTSMLDLVEPFLRKDSFKYVRYDGSMRNDAREESLRRLREDPSTRILLCSLKCGSLGLNLTAATRVIIVEPFWNPVSSSLECTADTPC